jgi:dihydropteroate synthase
MRGLRLSNADHTLVIGVLNVTPDSFSDGGRYLNHEAAVAHGIAMWVQGADLIDVGGESTRPGAAEVPAGEEAARVVPVIADLAAHGVLTSVDTSKAAVATLAVQAGAVVINDVTAFSDPAMAAVAAASECGVVLMHMQGTPRTMQADPHYDDVVAEVTEYLQRRVDHAVAAGVAPDRICLDPGIGFGKNLSHNLDLLGSGVSALAALGHPVLVGASRKSFLEKVLGPIPAAERDTASGAAHTLAIACGASAIRVHNVVEGLRSARVTDAIVRRTP